MNGLMAILILSLATTVQAGEVKIVETETGIIAEYTGTPSASSSNENELTATTVNSSGSDRLKYLSSQIEQLKMEAADIMTLTGDETEDELALKNAFADIKKEQIEAYAKEIGLLTGNAQKKEADAAQPKEEQPLRQQNYRQEKKRQIMELKKLRMSSPLSADPQ